MSAADKLKRTLRNYDPYNPLASFTDLPAHLKQYVKPTRKRKRSKFIVNDYLIYDVAKDEGGNEVEYILLALHEIEALMVANQARYVDLSASIMKMNIQYRTLCQLQYWHNREAFNLVPTHVVNNLLYNRARMIGSQPIGERSYPALRPLGEIQAHYDNRYIRFERDEAFDGWTIQLPRSELPLGLSFHKPDNQWASDKMEREMLAHRIVSATLKYRGTPKPNKNNHKQLVIRFDTTQPAHQPYQKARKRVMEIQRMYYKYKIDTRDIARELNITIRTVQLALKGTENPYIHDDELADFEAM